MKSTFQTAQRNPWGGQDLFDSKHDAVHLHSPRNPSISGFPLPVPFAITQTATPCSFPSYHAIGTKLALQNPIARRSDPGKRLNAVCSTR